MKVIAKLKEKIKYENEPNEKLVLLVWDKGNELEYSVHTEINGSYLWGHYFGDGLESAIEYYNNYDKELTEKVELREVALEKVLKSYYLSIFKGMEIIEDTAAGEFTVRHKCFNSMKKVFETRKELNNHLIKEINEHMIDESREENKLNISSVCIEGLEVETLTEEEFNNLLNFIKYYELGDEGVELSDEKILTKVFYEMMDDGSYDIIMEIKYL